MTQATLSPDYIADNEIALSPNQPHESSESLVVDTKALIECDVSERPVREKLKKTSIASISQQDRKPHDRAVGADEGDHLVRPETESSPINKSNEDPVRVRPVKKRSFDQSETIQYEIDTLVADASQKDTAKVHVRKRSRDFSSLEPTKADRQLRTIDAAIGKEGEETPSLASSIESIDAESKGEKRIPQQRPAADVALELDTDRAIDRAQAEEGSQETDPQFVDREMHDPTSSPRRKRSREQVETDSHREQKIPATEEARAQRRSDELERKKSMEPSNESSVISTSSISFGCSDDPKAGNAIGNTSRGNKVTVCQRQLYCDTPQLIFFQENPPDILENAARVTSSVNEEKSASPVKFSRNTQSQISGSTFASSGFAAFSSSSASPFGALGAPSNSAASSIPVLSKMEDVESTDTSEYDKAKKAEPLLPGGFGSFAKPSTEFSTSESSLFLTPAAGRNGFFGGSIFGHGFGGGFGSGEKLTNFAAPVGDIKLGTSNGDIKPIGSPSHQGADDKDTSDDGGEGEGEVEGDGGEESDEIFQRQNGRSMA